MEKTIKMKINKNIFPKLFEVKNINKTLLVLLNIGYQQVYSSINEKNLIENFKKISKEDKEDNKDILNKIDLTINKLFGISLTSNKKGELSEMIISEMINNKYPNYSYNIKRHISHSGDGELISPTGLKCLVEIKNYKSNIPTDEIIKFKNDLRETNNKFGLFISIQSNIVGKQIIDYEILDDIHIVYISHLNNNLNNFDTGLLLLENLYKLVNKNLNNIKLDFVKKNIYNDFNELNKLLNKIDKLRNNYNIMEKNIQNNLNNFYKELKTYDLDIKNKVNLIWKNLFYKLENINIDTNILLDISKDDNCYLILSKIVDYMNSNNIIIVKKKKLYNLIKNTEIIGYMKKMKNKITITINNILVSFDSKTNLNRSLEIINKILECF